MRQRMAPTNCGGSIGVSPFVDGWSGAGCQSATRVRLLCGSVMVSL